MFSGVDESLIFSSFVCQEALEEGGKLYGKKVYVFGCTERKLLLSLFLILL
jgi:hypothetical protein